MYTQVLQPHLLIVHSQNRSGMMLNSFDCHEKGLMALKVGWQESKVADSYCFEMSQNKAKKDSQMSAMQKLVQSSEKRLAPVTGQERFMTVSCSHMSQFAKAAGSGQCVSELPELETFSMEAIDAHFADEQFKKMVKDGWQWNVIQADVEEGCPWFPQMLQASLNTGKPDSEAVYRNGNCYGHLLPVQGSQVLRQSHPVGTICHTFKLFTCDCPVHEEFWWRR